MAEEFGDEVEIGAHDDDERYIVKPVAKALKVLFAICTERHPTGLNDLIALTGLPKTTVFRYVSTLRAAGLIDVSPSGDRYSASLGLWLLGQTAGVHEMLRSICLPVMLALQKEFNETVNLGTLRGRQVVYIEIVESERSLRMQARPGAQDPIHSTALGKALLAFMPEERWASYVDRRLERFTEHTITDHARLREQLREARQAGVAYDRGENEEWALCIAVPLLVRAGSPPLAALSISAPANRFEGKAAAAAVVALKAGAAEIEARLRDTIGLNGSAALL
jgi:IclR family acetate operon transcriptional repressor